MVNLKEFFKMFFSLLLSVMYIIFSLIVVILILGVILALIERKPIPEYIYLAFVTVLTVGQGYATPTTWVGKIVNIILGITGMMFMGVIVAACVKAIERVS